MKKIKLRDRWIGEGESCFIITEAGSNHDGELETAKRLVKAAKDAGADAIKFQTFKAEKFASPQYAKEMYKTLEKHELKTEWHAEIKKYADELGIIFLSTPFDEGSVDLLDEIGVPAFKVASGDLTHLPLLEHIAGKGKPMIVSTGGANLGEVEEAINTIKNRQNNRIVLTHCVSNYPTKVEDANIRAMITLRDAFHLPVGYSDHSLGSLVSLAAVALGACIIEKHFTFDRSLPGPDHPFAMEPDELKEMIIQIRNTEKALGSPIKKRTKSEDGVYKRARRSIFARRNIPKGTKITQDMVAILRPSVGVQPKFLDKVIGRKSKVDIKARASITWNEI